MKLKTAYEHYREDRKGEVKRSTLDRYHTVWRNNILSVWDEDDPVEEIGEVSIAFLRNEIREDGYSESTADKAERLIRSLQDKAEEYDDEEEVVDPDRLDDSEPKLKSEDMPDTWFGMILYQIRSLFTNV